MKKSKCFLRIFTFIIAVSIIFACIASDINSYIISSSSKYIISAEEASSLSNVDCILVLGCGVYGNIPSPLLEDRLTRGIELYKSGVSHKILMSGDHGQKNYDEVNVMRTFAENNGVPADNIFMDHAGFSTYESMYRARDVFCAQKIVIVTQKYHLSRAIFVARALGLDAFGVSSDYHIYAGQKYRDFREFLAREKDFIYTLFKPKPKYLGEKIQLTGSGITTLG